MSEVSATGGVRPARDHEWRELGHLLAAAFQDDPVWEWIAPDPERRARHLRPAFAQLIRRRVLGGTTWTNADLSGGAVWAPPGEWKTRPGEILRMAWPMTRAIGLREVNGRTSALSAMDRHHPTEPHWYLAILGADPARRGQGIGSALMAPMIERCDREGEAAYLESSKEENLAFYHRFGFEVTGELTLAPDSPTIWTMWRNPR